MGWVDRLRGTPHALWFSPELSCLNLCRNQELQTTHNNTKCNTDLPNSSVFSVYLTSNELPSRDPRNKYPSPHSQTYKDIVISAC